MKNLRDFFDLYEKCIVCGGKNKHLSVTHSTVPTKYIKYAITKNYLNISFDAIGGVNARINLNSNEIIFDIQYAPLVQGEFDLSLNCPDCNGIWYDGYCIYSKGTVRPPYLMRESVTAHDGDTKYRYEVNHWSRDGGKIIIFKNINGAFEETGRMVSPVIPLKDFSKEKFLNKIKNILLLS